MHANYGRVFSSSHGDQSRCDISKLISDYTYAMDLFFYLRNKLNVFLILCVKNQKEFSEIVVFLLFKNIVS